MNTPAPICLDPKRRRLLKGFAWTGIGLLAPAIVRADASPPWQLAERAGKPLLPLHYNENSLGMSPKALAAAQSALANAGNRYPMQANAQLKEVLAQRNAIDPTQVLFGNGSSELLGSVAALMAQQRQTATLVEPAPTFGGLRSHAVNYGLQVESVPVGKGFVTDIQALRHKTESIKGPVLVNICNPNNPTATIVDHKALTQWITEAPDSVFFLLDEAYYEYAKTYKGYQSALPLIQQGKENLFVIRTFSKIYGMAGMRIGYGFAAPETAKKLKGFSADWNLNIGGITAAMASLEDQDFYRKSLNSNHQAKAITIKALESLNLDYIPSYGNFILHKINTDVDTYSARMLANNIKVGRRMTPEDGWNRLSIGTPEQMMAFGETLQAFRSKGWV